MWGLWIVWKILSDRNWTMKANGCENLSDEWRKLSDHFLLAKQALNMRTCLKTWSQLEILKRNYIMCVVQGYQHHTILAGPNNLVTKLIFTISMYVMQNPADSITYNRDQTIVQYKVSLRCKNINPQSHF